MRPSTSHHKVRFEALSHHRKATSVLQIWPSTCISYFKMMTFIWDISTGGNIITYSGIIAPRLAASLSSVYVDFLFQLHECPGSLPPLWSSPVWVLESVPSVRPHVRMVHARLSLYFYQVRMEYFTSEHLSSSPLLSQLQKSVLCNLPNVRSWGLSNKGKKGGKKKGFSSHPFLFPPALSYEFF